MSVIWMTLYTPLKNCFVTQSSKVVLLNVLVVQIIVFIIRSVQKDILSVACMIFYTHQKSCFHNEFISDCFQYCLSSVSYIGLYKQKLTILSVICMNLYTPLKNSFVTQLSKVVFLNVPVVQIIVFIIRSVQKNILSVACMMF